MYISVKEAAELTGKSSTTIYRLCNKRINTRFVKKENNKFSIDRDFVLATYPIKNKTEEEKVIQESTLNKSEQDSHSEKESTEEQLKTVNIEIVKSEKIENDNTEQSETNITSTQQEHKPTENKQDTDKNSYKSESYETIEFEFENTTDTEIIEVTENNAEQELENESANKESKFDKDVDQKSYIQNILSKDVIVNVSIGIAVMMAFIAGLYFMAS